MTRPAPNSPAPRMLNSVTAAPVNARPPPADPPVSAAVVPATPPAGDALELVVMAELLVFAELVELVVLVVWVAEELVDAVVLIDPDEVALVDLDGHGLVGVEVGVG
jgi:hypothetical protein